MFGVIAPYMVLAVLQADAVAQALPPHARPGPDHGPRIKHTHPNRMSPGSYGVLPPVVRLHSFHAVPI